MTTVNLTVDSLKNLVDNAEIDPTMFPVKSGNRINIGSYSIKDSDGTYSIKSYKSNKIVAHTYTKAGALAAAKLLAKNKSIEEVLILDNQAAKYRNDCMFYKHTMQVTDNPVKWETTWVRYDIAKAHQDAALNKIKKFIL